MPSLLPSTLLALNRRIVSARQGGTLIGYSSFVLLVAIAAIAVLTQVRTGATAPSGAPIGLSS